VKIDNTNITMEEYIRLQKEKVHRHGKVFNWETVRVSFDESDDEDCTPTVCYFDDLDFVKDFENEFPAIIYNDAQTSELDLLTEPTECVVVKLRRWIVSGCPAGCGTEAWGGGVSVREGGTRALGERWSDEAMGGVRSRGEESRVDLLRELWEEWDWWGLGVGSSEDEGSLVSGGGAKREWLGGDAWRWGWRSCRVVGMSGRVLCIGSKVLPVGVSGGWVCGSGGVSWVEWVRLEEGGPVGEMGPCGGGVYSDGGVERGGGRGLGGGAARERTVVRIWGNQGPSYRGECGVMWRRWIKCVRGRV
ncbi:hypothetical protein Tco_0508979, partial [Tanacetum coccineum]